MSAWQPIETAPKDGTWIIVRMPWCDDPALVRWDSHGYWRTYSDSVDIEGGCAYCGGHSSVSGEPDVWAPVPAVED